MPVIKKRDSYRWTVEHVVAVVDGKHEMLRFDAEFKALPQSRVDALIARAARRELDNEAFIAETMAGWHDMKREDGSAWEFSVAAVLELCEIYPGVPASLSKAWTDSVMGAARKN